MQRVCKKHDIYTARMIVLCNDKADCNVPNNDIE